MARQHQSSSSTSIIAGPSGIQHRVPPGLTSLVTPSPPLADPSPHMTGGKTSHSLPPPPPPPWAPVLPPHCTPDQEITLCLARAHYDPPVLPPHCTPYLTWPVRPPSALPGPTMTPQFSPSLYPLPHMTRRWDRTPSSLHRAHYDPPVLFLTVPLTSHDQEVRHTPLPCTCPLWPPSSPPSLYPLPHMTKVRHTLALPGPTMTPSFHCTPYLTCQEV